MRSHSSLDILERTARYSDILTRSVVILPVAVMLLIMDYIHLQCFIIAGGLSRIIIKPAIFHQNVPAGRKLHMMGTFYIFKRRVFDYNIFRMRKMEQRRRLVQAVPCASLKRNIPVAVISAKFVVRPSKAHHRLAVFVSQCHAVHRHPCVAVNLELSI